MTLVARPTYLANRAVAFDDFIGGLGIAQPPRVSLKDDRFTLLDETGMTIAEPTLSLDVVIVSANKNASRMFYGENKPYDPNNNEGPICWSDNGVGPSKACQQPQSPTCGACEYAQWKWPSKMTGKPVPLCSTRKKLAVLVSGQEGMFLLTVPPDSLSGFKQYMGTLAKMPASPEELVTRIKMENKQLVFEAVDWVPEDFMGYIAEKMETDDAASIVNRHDEARDPAEFKVLPAPHGEPAQAIAAQSGLTPPAAPSLSPPNAVPPRRGRPPKLAAPAPQQQAINRIPVPLNDAPPPAAPPQFAPSQPASMTQGGGAPPPPGFGFGMQSQPQAPDPGVQGMLDRAFSLPRRA